MGKSKLFYVILTTYFFVLVNMLDWVQVSEKTLTLCTKDIVNSYLEQKLLAFY